MIGQHDKIVLTGAAGLVGQNLALVLREQGYTHLVGIDKQPFNTRVLRELNPDMQVITADLARPGDWAESLRGARTLVMLQAQIGGPVYAEFVANTLTATENVLAACRAQGVEYVVHVSSSVVNSHAVDFYTETKKAQERLVLDSGIPCVVLRPTLMFGWFDRKHLGWLSRFMQRVPVFPIPGSGRYPRQPLYNRDFCRIIAACIARRITGATYNISGMDEVDYIDIIRTIKATVGARTWLLRIPYRVFWLLLQLYAVFDRNPPFTTKQLKALVTPDRFEVIPWDTLFGVRRTPFAEAIRETFTDPRYAHIVLQF